MQRSLIIFVKWPESGRVKTRLGKTIGPEKAAQVYRRMVIATAHIARSQSEAELIFCFSPPDKESAFLQWFRDEELLDDRTRLIAQVDGDLGKRQAAAGRQAFDQGADQVLVIGSDCLALTPGHLESAWAALGNGSASEPRAVMGPAEDGGYYLLGFSQWKEGIFADVPWSSPQTAERCRENLYDAGYDLVSLEVLKDIDTYDDFCSEYPNP